MGRDGRRVVCCGAVGPLQRGCRGDRAPTCYPWPAPLPHCRLTRNHGVVSPCTKRCFPGVSDEDIQRSNGAEADRRILSPHQSPQSRGAEATRGGHMLKVQAEVAESSTSATGLRIGVVSAFPPSRNSLNEYGYHLVKHLARLDEVAEVIVYCDITSAGDPDPMPGVVFEPSWEFNGLGTLRDLPRRHRPYAAGRRPGQPAVRHLRRPPHPRRPRTAPARRAARPPRADPARPAQPRRQRGHEGRRVRGFRAHGAADDGWPGGCSRAPCCAPTSSR